MSEHDIDLSIGLEWRQINGDNLKREIDEIIRLRGNKHGVLRKIKHEDEFSYQIGLASSPNEEGKISLATLVADKESNCLVLHSGIQKDRIWICGVSEGEIVVGSDALIPAKQLFRIFEDTKEILDEGDSDYIIYTDNEIASMLDIQDYETYDLGIFIGGGDHSHASIKNLQKKSPILTAAMVAGLLVGGYFTYTQFNNDNLTAQDFVAPAMKDISAINEERERKRQEALDNARKKAIDDEKNWLNDYLTNVHPEKTFGEIIRFIEGVQISTGGWTLTNTVWSSLDKYSVVNTWIKNNNPYATPVSIMLSLDYDDMSVDPSGEKIGTKHGLTVSSMPKYNEPFQIIKNDRNQYEFLLHSAAMKRLSTTIGKQPPMKRATPIEEIEDENIRWNWITKVKSYDIAVSGQSLADLDSLKLFLVEHKNIVPKTLKYNHYNKQWAFTGIFYEK